MACTVLLLAACSPRPPRAAARPTPPAAVRLTVLSINDLHGQLDPVPLKSTETPPRTFAAGGAEALAATIAELRAQNPEGTLLLDGGDAIHGSLLSDHFEGEPVLALHELLGVDAGAIGNHEFDFGPAGPRSVAVPGDDPRGALKAWTRRASHPLLSANIVDPAGRWPNVQPHLLLERRGVRVGVLGLTTPETKATTQLANVKDLRFEPLAATARREAAALRRAGADAVIAVAHVLGQCDGPQQEHCHGELFELLRTLPRGTLDAVVAGHAHRRITGRHHGVLVSEACSRGLAVGRLELVVRPGRGVDHAASRVLPPVTVCHEVFADTADCEGLRRQGPPTAALRPSPVRLRQPAAAAAARRLVARYRARIAPLERRVLARLGRRVPCNRHGWSELGFLFAEVMRQALAADAALMNAGGVRADLPAGPVTFADLYAASPFENDLALVTLSGAQLRALITAAVARQESGVPVPAGLRMLIRCGPPRALVALTRDDGTPLEPERLYRVALPDFMLAGDGLNRVLSAVPAARKRVLVDRRVRDEVARHLAQHGTRVLERLSTPTVTLEGQCVSAAPAAQAPRPLCD